MSSLFLGEGGSVCGCMCWYTHTHTHTAREVLDVSPGVGTRHLEVPKTQNLVELNLSISVCIHVYKVDMCVYMLGGGMRS